MMVNYILLQDKILQLITIEPINTNFEGFFISKRVIASDILNESQHYAATIKCLHEPFEAEDEKISYAILIEFKNLCADGSLQPTRKDITTYTINDYKSLFLYQPSLETIQNELIRLLGSVFGIKPEILFTLDELIVSTGFSPENLSRALSKLIEIGVVEKSGSVGKYALNKKIKEELDKLK
jgi:hypothetical protein